MPPRAQPVHHLRGVPNRLLIDWASSSREGRDVALRLVTTVLAASSCHAQFPTQETISEMPFGFWYILQDDIIACEPEQYQQCVALFGPIYTALVNAMLHKSMYDPNDGEWSTDQRESLRCYRTDIADTIMYSFNILRDGLLHSLLQQLDHAIAACLTAPRPGRPSRHASTPGTPWPSPSPTARRRRPTPALHVPGQAPRHPLPQQHTGDLHRAGLHRRVLRLAGHAPQLLPHVTPIVTSALTFPELSLAATMALKDISRDCTDSMKPSAEAVIASIQQSLQANRLNPGECVQLMYPLGKMLSLLPPAIILPASTPSWPSPWRSCTSSARARLTIMPRRGCCLC